VECLVAGEEEGTLKGKEGEKGKARWGKKGGGRASCEWEGEKRESISFLQRGDGIFKKGGIKGRIQILAPPTPGVGKEGEEGRESSNRS